MQVGDLVKNYYKELGIVIEEWVDEEKLFYERQYYVLYSNGKVVVTSEHDLEVISEKQ